MDPASRQPRLGHLGAKKSRVVLRNISAGEHSNLENGANPERQFWLTCTDSYDKRESVFLWPTAGAAFIVMER